MDYFTNFFAFGKPTIAVDTHIFRVANRTGLANGKTPLSVEKNLLKNIPDEFKLNAHHWLILHGRYVCKAQKPLCQNCCVADLCEKNQITEISQNQQNQQIQQNNEKTEKNNENLVEKNPENKEGKENKEKADKSDKSGERRRSKRSGRNREKEKDKKELVSQLAARKAAENLQKTGTVLSEDELKAREAEQNRANRLREIQEAELAEKRRKEAELAAKKANAANEAEKNKQIIC